MKKSKTLYQFYFFSIGFSSTFEDSVEPQIHKQETLSERVLLIEWQFNNTDFEFLLGLIDQRLDTDIEPKDWMFEKIFFNLLLVKEFFLIHII